MINTIRPTTCGHLVVLLLAALAAGCDSTASIDDVTLTTDAQGYVAGDEVHLRLENESGADVGHTLCFDDIGLQRRSGNMWENTNADLAPSDDVTCPSGPRNLVSGRSTTAIVYLPADAAAGTYRLVHYVVLAGEGRFLLPSNTFEIDVKPA